MKQLLFLSLALIFFISCKPSDARRPISKNSGSFIDASIERSKKLNNLEYAQIDAVINDSRQSFSIF